MNDNRWLSMPRGRKLEQPGFDPRYQGSVGVLRKADESSLRLARRDLREIAEEEIDGQGLRLVERTSGQEWEVVTAAVDLIDPKASGVEAFCVRDGLFVPLRPIGWTHAGDKTERLGEVGSRPARGDDPMPMSSGLEIH
jgi:hypothetical protein